MNSILSIALQVPLIVAAADFLAGVVHWLEDAYGHEDTPVLGPLVIRPNIVHHHHPRFFTHFGWFYSSWMLLAIGVAVLLGAWAGGFLSWQLALFVAININANEVHKWSHRTRAENGRLISALQDWRILQTPRQHAVHHTDPKNTYYCPITNIVNPVLERLRFWHRLEAIIESLTGVKHREDTSVRGQGPGPAWLAEYRPVHAHNRPPASTLGPKHPHPSAPTSLTSSPVRALTPHAATQLHAKLCTRETCRNCPGCNAARGKRPRSHASEAAKR